MNYVIAYDLGTGGTKASLFDESGKSVASKFSSCETTFPKENFREQNPEDWWKTVKESTLSLLKASGIDKHAIKAIGVSGHSLGVVPMSKDGQLLSTSVPIWSDARAEEEEYDFFKTVNEQSWYLKTGNGFPPRLYSVFKMMWYKKHMPKVYDEAHVFLGTKDYINYMLTGKMVTDYSYASGSGVFDLSKWSYDEDLIKESGLCASKFPEIFASDDVIGLLKEEIADLLGLSAETKVVCGGVDNSCMALGANCKSNGDSYTSLGTSAWIAVSSDKPILDYDSKPYVFAHCIKGQYVSATAIFSAGNSYRWVRDQLCRDLDEKAELENKDVYELMNIEAGRSKVGANKLLFNPSLAGGSSLDDSLNIKGAFVGLSLAHTREDMIRSALEGISMNLRIALDSLEEKVSLSDKMLIVGGGAKSDLWNQLFADIFNKTILTSSVGQNAGSLGAAALAFKGAEIWTDYSPMDQVHKDILTKVPDQTAVHSYEKLMPVFKKVSEMQSEIGDLLATVNN